MRDRPDKEAQRRDRWVRTWAPHLTTRELGKLLGRSKEWVRRRARALGVPARPAKARPGLPSAKLLRPTDVTAIRAELDALRDAAGRRPRGVCAAVARRWRTSRQTISSIARGLTWRG